MSGGTFILESSKVAGDQQSPGRRVVVSLANRPEYVPGRRSWIKYRELGVTEGTSRAMRAQVIEAGPADNRPTGWHLHRCDMQFLYVISGVIHIAFNPDEVIRLGAGDSIMIPGGTVHQELGAPDGLEVLEISLPAEMGTENCESPWGGRDVDFSKHV